MTEDEAHEATGAMLFRGLEEARAYARTTDGEAHLCRKLNEMADDWQACGSVEYPPILRLAAERISELGRHRDFYANAYDECRRDENEACARLIEAFGVRDYTAEEVAARIRARMEKKG